LIAEIRSADEAMVVGGGPGIGGDRRENRESQPQLIKEIIVGRMEETLEQRAEMMKERRVEGGGSRKSCTWTSRLSNIVQQCV
jgi:hypothetical protein